MRVAALGLLLVTIPAALADHSATRPPGRGLRAGDLAGFLAGEKGDVAAKIEFRGAGEATWQIRYGGAIIVADLVLVDDAKAGVVRLRFDSAVASTVVGELARDDAGRIRLTVLPAASKVSERYQPVNRIPLGKADGW